MRVWVGVGSGAHAAVAVGDPCEYDGLRRQRARAAQCVACICVLRVECRVCVCCALTMRWQAVDFDSLDVEWEPAVRGRTAGDHGAEQSDVGYSSGGRRERGREARWWEAAGVGLCGMVWDGGLVPQRLCQGPGLCLCPSSST